MLSLYIYVLPSQSNSSEINFDEYSPWFYPFFGTLVSASLSHSVLGSSPIVLASRYLIFVIIDQAMGGCQFFGENLYNIMSNAGVLIFVITILLLMSEVDKDMVLNDHIASFLVQVARKGDELPVSPSPQPEGRGHRRSEEEVKRTEEKNGAAVLTDSDTNAARVVRKHNVDDGRTSSALDDEPDKDIMSNQCEALMNSRQDTDGDVENGPYLPDVVQSVGDRAEGEKRVMLSLP